MLGALLFSVHTIELFYENSVLSESLFVFTLSLVLLGLVQVGNQAHADRYTYLPQVGLYIMLVWGGASLAARRRGRRFGLGAAGGGGLVALGVVVRGETPHFDYIAAEVSKGLAHVSMSSGVPVAFGVLTTDTIEQAVERAGSKAGNKGFDAAMAAIEMANLYKAI